MTTDLSKFNNTIEQFVEALYQVYHDQECAKNLEIFKEKFLFLRKANARKPYEQFYLNVLPHSKQIKERDENYFMEMEENSQLFKLLKLKELWVNATDQVKETIWTYFNVLIILADRIASASQ